MERGRSAAVIGLAWRLLWLLGALELAHAQATCANPPVLNREVLPGNCRVLHTVCVDHGSLLVTHDERYHVENVRREGTPELPRNAWNLPVRANSYPDALVGLQPDFVVRVRPVSKAEPTPMLRHPVFSNCTLPFIFTADYTYNYKTFMVKLLTDVDDLFRGRGVVPDRAATLLLATPSGLALEPYHGELLSYYSRHAVTTLADMGRRGMDGAAVPWSGEGTKVVCFNQVVSCKLEQQSGVAPHAAANAAFAGLEGRTPRDPLGFEPAAQPPGAPLWEDSTLRVVVEARSAGWRVIRNAEAIVRACEEENAKGFSAGPFRRISCKLLRTAYATDPPATGPIDPSAPAAVTWRTAVGAVRSAHLFVAAAGASGAHAFFMQPDRGAGLLEVRPCGWGSKHSELANDAADAMAKQLAKGDDAIRFFAYNVEDAAQCSPPDCAAQLQPLLAAGGPPPAIVGHPHMQKSAPRYAPDQLLARDQHMDLRPGPLLVMIKHAAALLRDRAAYQAARTGDRLHGYAVAEGLLLGPPGVKDVPLHLANHQSSLIRV